MRHGHSMLFDHLPDVHRGQHSELDTGSSIPWASLAWLLLQVAGLVGALLGLVVVVKS